MGMFFEIQQQTYDRCLCVPRNYVWKTPRSHYIIVFAILMLCFSFAILRNYGISGQSQVDQSIYWHHTCRKSSAVSALWFPFFQLIQKQVTRSKFWSQVGDPMIHQDSIQIVHPQVQQHTICGSWVDLKCVFVFACVCVCCVVCVCVVCVCVLCVCVKPVFSYKYFYTDSTRAGGKGAHVKRC